MKKLSSCWLHLALLLAFFLVPSGAFTEEVAKSPYSPSYQGAASGQYRYQGAPAAPQQGAGPGPGSYQQQTLELPAPSTQGFPQAAIEEDEPLSVFENYVNQTIIPYLNGSQLLRQFGYDIFSREAPFDPTALMPVGPSYLLSPGDEVKISVWGKLSYDMAAVIDRDGMINLGEFGAHHIAGQTFSEAKGYLQGVLARYYKPGEVRMNVSIGALASMRVFVVGRAARPGSYTVSSMSSLMNAVVAAGGPSREGSMRSVKVMRGGKAAAEFDLYDLLMKGDKSGDTRLQPDDVILIPPAGALVAMAGFVKVPAIYELRGETTVRQALEMAGGANELAFHGRLRIDRVAEGGRITALESNLDAASLEAVVRPGDIMTVYDAMPDKRLVRISGAVHREGEYGAGDGLTVSGLVRLAGGLKPSAYGRDAELTRVTPTPDGPKTTKQLVDVGKAMQGDPAHDQPLKEYDYLFIKTIPEWLLYRTVTLSGEVRFPGVYTIEKGEDIHSLISRAGGYTDKAFLKGSVFTRVAVRDSQQVKLDESISRLEYEFFSISAEAVESALDPRAAEQLKLAMEQRRALIAKLRGAKALGRIVIELDSLDRFRQSAYNIPLEDGDSLHIPETPGQVQVIGSVYNQTAFVYSRGSSASEYLKLAGGLTRNADEDEIYILKVNGTAVSKRENSGWSVNWDKGGNRWVTGFMSRSLDPGDTIVVPEKIEQVAWMREFKDLTQILYQIAVTAGVLIVAF